MSVCPSKDCRVAASTNGSGTQPTIKHTVSYKASEACGVVAGHALNSSMASYWLGALNTV